MVEPPPESPLSLRERPGVRAGPCSARRSSRRRLQYPPSPSAAHPLFLIPRASAPEVPSPSEGWHWLIPCAEWLRHGTIPLRDRAWVRECRANQRTAANGTRLCPLPLRVGVHASAWDREKTRQPANESLWFSSLAVCRRVYGPRVRPLGLCNSQFPKLFAGFSRHAEA